MNTNAAYLNYNAHYLIAQEKQKDQHHCVLEH